MTFVINPDISEHLSERPLAKSLLLLACAWSHEPSTHSLIAENIAAEGDAVLSELLTLRLAAINLMIERRVEDVATRHAIIDRFYGLVVALYGFSLDPPRALVSPRIDQDDVAAFKRAVDRDLETPEGPLAAWTIPSAAGTTQMTA